MTMYRFLVSLPVAVCATGGANAQMLPDAAVAQAEIIGQQMDANNDGVITQDEMHDFGGRLYDAMDADGSGQVALSEMSGWQFGMAEIAEFRGRATNYETAVAIVFDIFDRDNDQKMSRAEHLAAMNGALNLADLDDDGVLTMREYQDGFIFNIAVRNALEE